MRILLRIVLVVLVLLVVGLGALALYLPRLIQSPAVRERIETAARDATGRAVTWAALDFGLMPPRLVVQQPQVAGARPGDEPFAQAREVGLELALAPLLARAIVVDSLAIQGATVRLVRTADGIELPQPASAAGAGSAGAPAAAAPPEGAGEGDAGGGPGFALAVRSLRLSDARVILEDRSVSPPVTWDLSEVELEAQAESLDAPIPFRLSAVLASGGAVRGSGSAGLDGRADVALRLDGLRLAPVAPYVEALKTATGSLSGEVVLQGPASAPERVEADLALAQADLALDDLAVRGDATLRAELRGPGLAGPFELDATDAELVYGQGVFTKPRGRTATANGRISVDEAGKLALEYQVRIHNTDARGTADVAERTLVSVDAPAFALDGWEEMVPALAEYGLSGPVALEDLRIATAPLEVRGRIRLDGVRAALPESPPLAVSGMLDATGNAIRTQGIELTTAGQTLRLEGGVANLGTSMDLDLVASGERLDLEALLRAFSSLEDQVSGPADLRARLSGPLAGRRPFTELVKGEVRVDVGRGRLRGVSFLKSTFTRLGQLAEAAILVNRLRGSDALEAYYEDEFESAGGTLRIGGGSARTDDLRIVYRGYTTDLEADLDFDTMDYAGTGAITVGSELDAALSDRSRATARTPLVIPLARIRGNLADGSNRVDVNPRTATTLTLRYAGGRLGESLGGEEGELVQDVLEGLLGGQKQR